MGERALFLSRESACHAMIREGHIRGLSNEEIAIKGATFPKHVRGEFKGYEAFIPMYANAPFNTAILEE